MNIKVSRSLPYVKEELLKKGYTIVEDASTPCDVVICDLKNEGILDKNINGNIKLEGSLIIDSGSRSLEEIESIIENRVYNNII